MSTGVLQAGDIVDLLQTLAELGTAPPDRCALFGVGYEDAFRRLEREYLQDRFARGGSAEKFVIGTFGSGKTHFIRQLMETARPLGCVTAEVALSKDVDFTQSLIVYGEVARQVRAPEATGTGIRPLLRAALKRMRSHAPPPVQDSVVSGWIEGLSDTEFALPAYGRIVRRALEALEVGDSDAFDESCRWLEGEVTDGKLAKRLSTGAIAKAQENLYGKRLLLSLCQFIKAAAFQGTVIAFDEAEQGLSVDRKKMGRILSMLQSQINAVADLRNGAALLVYAITPDLMEAMERFAALQQRVADPAPGRGFFDGNTLAMRISLTERPDPLLDLERIGTKLCNLLYDAYPGRFTTSQLDTQAAIRSIAAIVDSEDQSSSSRRTMVKRTADVLCRLYEARTLDPAWIVQSREDSQSDDLEDDR